MSEKIPIKDILAAVDMGYTGLWDELDDEQRKALKSEFYILNRYVSNVKGQSREIQEHFVLTTNEYFNKHWYTLNKHPKLLWQLLSMCSYAPDRKFFHEWISYKKKAAGDKKESFLLSLYPNLKKSDVSVMAELMTNEEFKTLAKNTGLDDKQIAQLLK